MNVLIIPEDFRKDQFILRPIITAMLASVGRPRAKVEVCLDPLLGGIDRAMDRAELEQIIQARPTVDLFILCVDRDNSIGRRSALDSLEIYLQPKVKKPGGLFVGENAWQEIEVWVLAGHPLLPDWKWSEIRSHRDPKEEFFQPLADASNVSADDDGGRKRLGFQAAKKYKRVRQLCKEDIQALEKRLGAWISGEAVPNWEAAISSL